ncbi:MAG: tetratricopeptide repeat protein, partial [Candidatus Promineifilaceae bacterium]
MSEKPIMVEDKLFVGRYEEQKRFRAALAEVKDPPARERLPYVWLLHGDGGAGKTTLAKRFRDIALFEAPFANQFEIMWVDWEDERKKFPGLQVGRQAITAETVFKVLHAAAIRQRWGRQFAAYRKAMKQRDVAAKKVAEAITGSSDWDELDVLRTIGVDALAKIVRLRLPMIGKTGEELLEAFLSVGVQVTAEQAAKLRTAIETHLRAHLKASYFDYFLNPYEQVALALARGVEKVSKAKPLIVVLDSYEIVDQNDIWVRSIVRAAGPRVLWIISGRNDLVESRQFGQEYFKGYADDMPRRLQAYKMLPLSLADIRQYFSHSLPGRELSDPELEAISRVTRGIPLAVKEAADILRAGASLAELVGDINDAGASNQIVQRMTDRYLQHVVAEADKQAIYSLALADGDVELLRAMLKPAGKGRFDLEELLRRLERDYASVHADRARLHDHPQIFIREYLQAHVRRTSERVEGLNQRAVEHLRKRLAALEKGLPRLEQRCQDDNWVQAALALCEHLFWLDEAEAWRWAVPRYVEGVAYSPDLRDGMVKVIGDWRGLSESTARLYAVMQAAAEDDQKLLKVLTRLEERGFLSDDYGAERQAILHIQRGNLLLRQRQQAAALGWYERAEAGLPKEGRLLRERLAEAYELLVPRLIWADDPHSAAYSPVAERLLSTVLSWFPKRHYAWYLLGVNQAAADNHEEAIKALQEAVTLNAAHVASFNALGCIYLAQKQVDQAQEAYQAALKLDPKSPMALAGLGDVHRARGQAQEAVPNYEKALAQDSRMPAGHIGLGIALLALDRPKQALAAFQRAQALKPDLAVVQVGLGDVYQALGNSDQALAAYQKANELDPQYAAAYVGMGHLYRQRGRSDAALAAFNQAIAMDPGHAPAYSGLGDVHAGAQRPEQAMRAYEQAIQLGQATSVTYDSLAQAYRLSGRYQQALDAHQEAKSLDPAYAPSYENLGEVYMALGCYEEACMAYDESLAAQPPPPRPATLSGKGDALLALSRLDEAQATYEQALAQDQLFAHAYRGLGAVHRAQGELDKAREAFGHGVELAPQDADMQVGLGDVYLAEKQFKKALAVYQKALELDSADSRAQRGLGDVYYALNMPNAAREAYENALNQEPTLAAAYLGLGQVFTDQGNHRQAIASLRQAARYAPNNPAPAVQLGRLYTQTGHYDDAGAALQHAAQLRPQDPAIFEGLGDLERAQGRLPEAIAAYRRALEHQPQQASSHIRLGEVYNQLGRTQEALAAFQGALAAAPKDAAALTGLGQVCLSVERPQEAVAQLQQAVQSDPYYGPAYVGLADAHHALGQDAAALEHYRRALELDAGNAAAHLGLGRIHQQAGRLEDAAEAYRQAIAGRPDWAAAYNYLGETLTALGRTDQALESFQQSLSRQADQAAAQRGLGELYLRLGRPDEAAASFQMATDLDASD